MKSIEANFYKITEVYLSDVLNYFCVYVIWDSQAKKRATYIGYSKNVGTRMQNHLERWIAKPMNGYVAFFDNKDDALLVESLLIDSGKELDRLQKHNDVGIRTKIWNRLYDEHGKIKIYIKGHNPFCHPDNSFYKNKKLHTMEIYEDHYTDTFRSLKKAA